MKCISIVKKFKFKRILFFYKRLDQETALQVFPHITDKKFNKIAGVNTKISMTLATIYRSNYELFQGKYVSKYL